MNSLKETKASLDRSLRALARGASLYTQAAMNADPTSKSMQDLYQHAQANFAKRDEIGSYLNQALAAKEARRYQDSLVWMQKAYDAFPNDKAYEALQVARQRAADDAARGGATMTGSDAKNPPASSPYWPWPAGWGLTLLGGAWALKRKLDDENLTGPVAMTGVGISLLGVSMMFPPAAPATTPEGIQLILAPALARAAVGTVGSALTARGTVDAGQALISRASANDKAAPGDSTGTSQGPSSTLKKPSAANQRLQQAIDYLFRPTDQLPGGTAGAVRREALTGRPTGNKWHATKARDTINWLNKILKEEPLSPVDRATAEALRADLQQALLTKPSPATP